MPFGTGGQPTTDEAIGAMTATPATPRYGVGNISDVIGAEGGSHEPGVANTIGQGVDQVRTVIGRVLGTLAGSEAKRAIARQDQEREMMRGIALDLAASGKFGDAPEFAKHLGKYMDKDAIENLATVSMIAKQNPEVGEMLIASMAPKAAQVAATVRGQDVAAATARRGQDLGLAGKVYQADTTKESESAKLVEARAHNAQTEGIQQERNRILDRRINAEVTRSHEGNVTQLQKSLIAGGFTAQQAQSIADKLANHQPLTAEEQNAVKRMAGKDPAIGLQAQNAKLGGDNRKIVDQLNGIGDPHSTIDMNSATPDVLKQHVDLYNQNLTAIAANQLRMAKSDKEVEAIMNKLQDDIIGVAEEGGTVYGKTRQTIHIRDVPKFDNAKNPRRSVLVNPGDYIDTAVQSLANVQRGDYSKVTGKSPEEEALERAYLNTEDEAAEAAPDNEAAEE